MCLILLAIEGAKLRLLYIMLQSQTTIFGSKWNPSTPSLLEKCTTMIHMFRAFFWIILEFTVKPHIKWSLLGGFSFRELMFSSRALDFFSMGLQSFVGGMSVGVWVSSTPIVISWSDCDCIVRAVLTWIWIVSHCVCIFVIISLSWLTTNQSQQKKSMKLRTKNTRSFLLC